MYALLDIEFLPTIIIILQFYIHTYNFRAQMFIILKAE